MIATMWPDGSVSRRKINGSPGRARTADLVINSHPLYQLSYRGIENLQEDASYRFYRFLVNAFYQGHTIGLPSQRTLLNRGRPVFDRQMTRGRVRLCCSQKVKEVLVPGLLPSDW